MTTRANFTRGTKYFYVHKATLACAMIGGDILLRKCIGLHTERPEKDGRDYHRVELIVIRTKAEAKALDSKMAAARAKQTA